jgi:hypothetical protein
MFVTVKGCASEWPIKRLNGSSLTKRTWRYFRETQNVISNYFLNERLLCYLEPDLECAMSDTSFRQLHHPGCDQHPNPSSTVYVKHNFHVQTGPVQVAEHRPIWSDSGFRHLLPEAQSSSVRFPTQVSGFWRLALGPAFGGKQIYKACRGPAFGEPSAQLAGFPAQYAFKISSGLKSIDARHTVCQL